MEINKIGFFIVLWSTFFIFSRSPMLYIENYYGGPIMYQAKIAQPFKQGGQIIMKNRIDEKTIPNGMQSRVGTVKLRNEKEMIYDSVLDLYLGTSYSGWTPVRKIYEQTKDGKSIEKEFLKLDTEGELPDNNGKDAVLVINPSGYISGWNITLRWRTPGVTETTSGSFSMEQEAKDEKTYERQLQRGKISAQGYLDEIEKGLYEQDSGTKGYNKTLQILRTRDYEGAKKKYYSDLSIYNKLSKFGYPIIQQAVGNIYFNYQQYLQRPKAPDTQQFNLPPDEVRRYVKNVIQQQYTLYLQYQKNGWIQ
jgi:hypothetical protein